MGGLRDLVIEEEVPKTGLRALVVEESAPEVKKKEPTTESPAVATSESETVSGPQLESGGKVDFLAEANQLTNADPKEEQFQQTGNTGRDDLKAKQTKLATKQLEKNNIETEAAKHYKAIEENSEYPLMQELKNLLAQVQQSPTNEGGSVADNIFSKYAGLQALGNVTIKADPNFTRSKTGAGSIEYFSPTQDSVRYSSGLTVPHPKLGTHGILYDPNTNDEESIMLDMLHGMKDVSPEYASQRERLKQSLVKNFSGDIDGEWNEMSTQDKADGKEAFIDNWVDGVVRNLFIEGTPEEVAKKGYWGKAKETYLKDPKAKEAFSKLREVITTPPDISRRIEEIRNTPVSDDWRKGGNVTISETESYRLPNLKKSAYKTYGEMWDATIQADAKFGELKGKADLINAELAPTIQQKRNEAAYIPDGKDSQGNEYLKLNPMQSFVEGFGGSVEAIGLGLKKLNPLYSREELKNDLKVKYLRDNILFPKQADGVVAQGTEMLGGVTPLIAAGMVGAPGIGAKAVNALTFGTMDLGGGMYEGFAEGKGKGMSDDEAMQFADKIGVEKGLTGTVLGATMPMQSALGRKIFINKAEAGALKTFLAEQGVMVPAFMSKTLIDNLGAKIVGSERDITEGVGEAGVSAFMIGAMTHAIGAGMKLPAKTRDMFENTIAKNYGSLGSVINKAVSDGAVDYATGQRIAEKAKAFETIGKDLEPKLEDKLLPKQIEIDNLEKENETKKGAIAEINEVRVEELNREIKEDLGAPLSEKEQKEYETILAKEEQKPAEGKPKVKLTDLEKAKKKHFEKRIKTAEKKAEKVEEEKLKADENNIERSDTPVEDAVTPKAEGEVIVREGEGEKVVEKDTEIGIAFAPYRSRNIETIEQDAEIRNSPEYKKHKQRVKDIADELGVEIIGENETWGGYVDSESGKSVQEVSDIIRIKGTQEQAELMAARLGKEAPEMQDSVLVGHYSDAGKGIEYKIGVGGFDNAQKALRFLKDNGIEYFTVDKKTGDIIILDAYNISLEKINNFVSQLEANGIKTTKEYQAVDARLIGHRDYDSIIGKQWLEKGKQNRVNPDASVERAERGDEEIASGLTKSTAEPAKDYEVTTEDIMMPDGEPGKKVTIEKPDGEKVDLGNMYPEDVEAETTKKIRGYKLADSKHPDTEVPKNEAAETPKEDLTGKEIKFDHAGSERKGTVQRIDEKGNYKVRDKNGISYTVKPENARTVASLEKAKQNYDSLTKKIDALIKSKEKDPPPASNGPIGVLAMNPKNLVTAPMKALGFGDKLIAALTSKIEDGVARSARMGMANSNKYVSRATSEVQGLFKQLALTGEEMTQRRQRLGAINVAPLKAVKFYQNGANIVGRTPESLQNVHMVLDPEVYSKRGTTPKTEADLSPAEKNLYDLLRATNDMIHDWHYLNGRISEDTYNKNKGKYAPRFYDNIEFEGLPNELKEAFEDYAKQSNFSYIKERKVFEDVMGENSITEDPVYGTSMRLAQMLRNQAVLDYANDLSGRIKTYKEGDANIPNSYIKLEGGGQFGNINTYGKLTNKYVPRDVAEDFKGSLFINYAADKVFNAFKWYDRLSVRQFLKKTKTLYNPITQLGNIGSNYVFAMMNGIDPITYQARKFEAANHVKDKSDLYVRLVEEGILGTDINTRDLKMEAKGKPLSEHGLLSKIDDRVSEFYGSRDDIAKVAAFLAHTKDYGRSEKDALKRVSDGFQNYNNVGRFYDLAAKTPVLGNPFIKFKGDLMRIMKNNFSQRPLTNIALLVGLNTVATALSKWSDEDEIVKEVRERRKFIPKVPLPNFLGGDIPLVWQTPAGELNAARYFSPFNIYDMGDKGSTVEEVTQFLPYQLKKSQDMDVPLPQISDPFLGVYAQVAFDKDFRGKPILDPEETKWKEGNATRQEKIQNAATFIARQQIPFYSSADDMLRATNGKPDYYGRNKDLRQALLSNVIKVQEYNKPEAIEGLEKEIDFRMSQLDKLNGDIIAAKNLAEKNIAKIRERKVGNEQELIRVEHVRAENKIAEVMGRQAEIKRQLLEPERLLRKLGGTVKSTGELKQLSPLSGLRPL